MIHLQGKAISALQRRLSKPSAHHDDGLLLAVLHLMVADVSSALMQHSILADLQSLVKETWLP